jgi:CRP/FNR family cyclic AMP-dependent transcriptional regulator
LRRSFLGRLPRDVVDELVADGQRTDYPAGSTIYREGAAPREVLVVQGLLRVFMTSPDGRQVTVRYAREADVLGIAVMVGGPANVSVQTSPIRSCSASTADGSPKRPDATLGLRGRWPRS